MHFNPFLQSLSYKGGGEVESVWGCGELAGYSFVFLFSACASLRTQSFKEQYKNGVAKMSKPLPYHSHSLLFTLLFSCYLNVPVFISAHHFACIQAKLCLCHHHLVFQAQLCLNDKVTPCVFTLLHLVCLFFVHVYCFEQSELLYLTENSLWLWASSIIDESFQIKSGSPAFRLCHPSIHLFIFYR